MKPSALLAITLLVLTVSIALAAENGTDQVPHPAATRVLSTDSVMRQMERHMQEMRVEMERIRQVQDPAKRKQMLQNHMQGMMQLMQDMMQGEDITPDSDTAHAQRMMESKDMNSSIRYRLKEIEEWQRMMGRRMRIIQALMGQMLHSLTLSTPTSTFPEGFSERLSDEEYKP